MSDSPLVAIDGVSIAFRSDQGSKEVVGNVSLELKEREILALVGESGSGKTILSKLLLGLLPETARVTQGSVRYAGRNLLDFSRDELRTHRGKQIGMVFQEPMSSLNPSMRIGDQLAEGLRLHTSLPEREIMEACCRMLQRVRMERPAEVLRRFPHEFSGGMRQRIMLASVMLLKPRVLVADEPTTALDVVTQKEVLELMLDLVREEEASLWLVTHDLALVGEFADTIAVMEHGNIVETGIADQVLSLPRHSYTRRLIDAVPQGRRRAPREVPPARTVAVEGIRVEYSQRRLFRRDIRIRAVDDVTLCIAPRETLAVVGESGSGKSTLGRALLGLVEMTCSRFAFIGESRRPPFTSRSREDRKRMKMVFQDPFASLDPRMTVGAALRESLRHKEGLDREARSLLAEEMLNRVGLPAEFAQRLPHELSGGQRQRVCIARAVISDPALLIADEAVSALDVTVQAQVLRLLKDLQEERDFALLFISHDLAVVEEIADRVMVMYRGRIVEEGRVNQIFDVPTHPYTIRLLSAAPMLKRRLMR